MKLLQKLKSRWNIESNLQVFLILLVFTCTGFTTLFAREFVFSILGIAENDPFWLKTTVWLLTILPLYNILLLIYGAIFGQFDFFRGFLSKLMKRLLPN